MRRTPGATTQFSPADANRRITASDPLAGLFLLDEKLMPLLIDGYNLLWQTGIVGEGTGPGGFARSRRALLNFIARVVPEEEVPLTTIVFDSKEAPPGLPIETDHCGMRVLFASEYEDADALIEELIAADFTPRRLTVVSSDHRIQRAARRRRSIAVDSDVWYRQVIEQQKDRLRESTEEQSKNQEEMSGAELDAWLDAFGELDLSDLMAELDAADEQATPPPDADAEKQRKKKRQPPLKPGVPDTDDLRNPFPPDFAAGLEEMLAEEETPPSSKPTSQNPQSPRKQKPKPPPVEDQSLGNPFPPGYGEDLFENDDWLDEGPPGRP